MKFTKGKYAGKSATIRNSLLGSGDRLIVGRLFGKSYSLSKDIDSIRVVNKDEKRSISILMIAVLSITIIGILAIPFIIASGKKQDVTLQVMFDPDDKPNILVCNKSEWKVLSKYVSL